MKKLSIFAVVMLTIAILFSVKSFAQVKIAYVDRDGIIKQMPEYKKITDELEGLQKLYVDTVQTKEKELKTKAESFKARYEEAQKKVESGQVKSETELKSLSDEVAELQKELQTLDEALSGYKQKIQSELMQKQAELLKPLVEKMTKTVEVVAKEMKINFVLNKTDDVLIYGDKESDITFKVLDKLK